MKAIILLDMENVRVCLRNSDNMLDLTETRRRILALPDFEKIVGQFAFADYQFDVYNEDMQRGLRSAGFLLIQCPRLTNLSQGGKATDDNELIYIANWLVQNRIDFDTVFLMSGDGHFLRAVQTFQDNGKKVVRVNPELLHCSSDLAKAAPDTIDLLDVGKLPSPARPATLRATTERPRAPRLGNAIKDIYWEVDTKVLETTLKNVFEGDYDTAKTEEEKLYISVFRVFQRVQVALRMQKAKNKPTAFQHLLNLVTSDSNFPPIPTTGGQFVREVEPIEGFTETDYHEVLNGMTKCGLIVRGTVETATGPTRDYSFADDHYFIRALKAVTGDTVNVGESSVVLEFN
jgi:hypothetical protein